MAAPTFQSSTSATGVANGSLELNFPGSMAVNDIVVATITIRGTAGFTTPDGWDLRDQSLTGNTATSNGIASQQIFWRRVDGTEGATQVFARTGGNLGHGSMTLVRGCTPAGDPWEDFSTVTVSGTTNALVPTDITTTVADCLLIWVNSLADNGTVSGQTGTTPASWSERVDTGTNTGADGGLNVNTATLSSATTTSGINADSSIPGTHVVFLGALKPPVSVSVAPGTGAATWAGVAPTATVQIGNDVRVREGSDSSIIATAFNLIVATGTGAAAWAGIAPTVSIASNVAVAPATGAATWAGIAPSVAISGGINNDVRIRVGTDSSIIATVLTVNINPTGLAVGTALGTPNVSSPLQDITPSLAPLSALLAGSTQRIDPTEDPSGQSIAAQQGTATVSLSGIIEIFPTGVSISAVLGGPVVESTLNPTGLTVGALLGAAFAGVSHDVSPSGLELTVAIGTPTIPASVQAITPSLPAIAVALGLTGIDDGSAPPDAALVAARVAVPQPVLIELRSDVRANLASVSYGRLEHFVRCVYTVAVDHTGTCVLDVMPDAEYLASVRKGRVLRITDATAAVYEYRIEQVEQALDAPTVTITAKHVIHDLNRVFLWEAIGGIPSFALGATDLTALEWLQSFAIPTLIAAGFDYVDIVTVDSTRQLNLDWQGQTVLWLCNQLIDGTDLDLVYDIQNPGGDVERYGLSVMHRGADAEVPRIEVGENAQALEWTDDAEPLANVIIPQGKVPDGGIEATNIGEYAARVVAVDDLAITLEDPDGNPAPVYADDQVTDLYLELLVPPLGAGALS